MCVTRCNYIFYACSTRKHLTNNFYTIILICNNVVVLVMRTLKFLIWNLPWLQRRWKMICLTTSLRHQQVLCCKVRTVRFFFMDVVVAIVCCLWEFSLVSYFVTAVTTVSQRLASPAHQPARYADLRPFRRSFFVKRSLRCRVSDCTACCNMTGQSIVMFCGNGSQLNCIMCDVGMSAQLV